MYPLKLLSIQVVLALVLSVSVALTDKSSLNFVVTGDLPDGEHEVLFRFGDVVARETSATSGSTPAGTVTLLLRQISYGENLLQLVYKIRKKATTHRRMQLISCEQVEDRHLTLDFRRKFSRQLVKLHITLSAGNTSFVGPAGDSIVSQEMLDDAIDDDYETLPSSTVDLNSRLDDIRNVSVQILDHVQVPSEYKHLVKLSHLEQQCERVQQRQQMQVQQRLEEAARNGTSSGHSRSLARSKREIYGKDVTSIFRVPGTKWCGVGYSAKEGKELGGLAGVDKCCRFHDLKCPFYIEGFQEKYGLRNWRMYTMMECSCDESWKLLIVIMMVSLLVVLVPNNRMEDQQSEFVEMISIYQKSSPRGTKLLSHCSDPPVELKLFLDSSTRIAVMRQSGPQSFRRPSPYSPQPQLGLQSPRQAPPFIVNSKSTLYET